MIAPLVVAALLAADAPAPVADTQPLGQSSEFKPEAAHGPLSDRSLVREDLDPSVKLLESDDLEMRFGGLLQVQSALYAGEDALITNGDPASEPGFRLRRARIGVEGRIGKRGGVFLNINLLENDSEVGTVADAKLTYAIMPALGLALGTSKVPFARGALLSSRTLIAIERPRVVGELTPDRRLGLTAEGSVSDGKFAYLASVMNGTEGFTRGNQFGGYLVGVRVEATPLGRFEAGVPGATGVGVGGGVLRDSGPSVVREAYSVDVVGAYAGASLTVEGLCDRTRPVVSPVGNTPLAQTERCGLWTEAAYALQVRDVPLQVTARMELFDDNRRLSDAGDMLFLSGGVNAQVFRYGRVQLQYLMRRERAGLERANDVLVAMFQGAF